MSDQKQAVIVFSFPEPEDSLELGEIIVMTKQLFLGRNEVKIHLAIERSARLILDMFDPDKQGESGLVEHARKELALVGNDTDFNESIIDAVRGFTSYGHSGGSAPVAIAMLNDLLQHKNLSPLTDNPDEWMHHTEEVWGAPGGVWQNRRNSKAFSTDGGKTYTLNSEKGVLSEGDKPIHTSVPYVVKEESESGS